MASAFGHALVALTAGKSFYKDKPIKFIFYGCICSVFPDADVLMFNFVPYEHFLGHRGFFHSFFFCFIFAFIVDLLFFSRQRTPGKDRLARILFFFLCGVSHGLLDMMTTGGLGIAVLSPFDDTRYFFPWRPIKVSPLGIGKFFSERGLKVLKSEFLWIALPCLICFIISSFVKRRIRH